MASDVDIQGTIRELMAEEHQLRQEVGAGEISPAQEQGRLRQIEVELDQCWDLLRQRRARREFGGDPDGASVRPGDTVEGYLS